MYLEDKKNPTKQMAVLIYINIRTLPWVFLAWTVRQNTFYIIPEENALKSYKIIKNLYHPFDGEVILP